MVFTNNKNIFLSILLFLSYSSFGQKQFLNLNLTPIEWHKRSMNGLKSIAYAFNKLEHKTKSDSVFYFFNIAGLYSNLGENADTVFYYIDLGLSIDRSTGCSILISNNYTMKTSKQGMYWGKLDPSKHISRLLKCKKYQKSRMNSLLNKIKSDPSLDQILISKIDNMYENDQKYRFTHQMDKQRIFDDENRILLDSIFTHYGYPGKTKVSNLHAIDVATIFLHLGLEFQEKWLYLLIEAYKKDELDKGSLKYALDRIHTTKYKKQFFGSQRLVKKGELINVEKYSLNEQKEILSKLGIKSLLKKNRS